MGISNSKSIKLPLAQLLQPSRRDIDLTEVKKPVQDPFYMSTRLTPIDWRTIVKETSQTSRRFLDPFFKAHRDSIIDPMIQREKRIQMWDNFVWKRPAEVYGEGNYQLFNGISPDDIRQGHCGDCYFLSSVGSLAEVGGNVEDIFLTKEVNKVGCYAVRLWVDGVLREVVVDDLFPFDPYKEQWAFTRTN